LSLLGPNTLLSTLFSNTLSLRSSLNVMNIKLRVKFETTREDLCLNMDRKQHVIKEVKQYIVVTIIITVMASGILCKKKT
jgi:hypothetical protein